MRDEQFIRTKVPMTKEEIRALSIDYLALDNAKVFIDVGAGTGSICIEACLRNPNLKAIAIEKNPEAVDLIKQNCEKFSVQNIEVIAGHAPVSVPVDKADAIFVGGSGQSLKEIIDWSGQLLVPQGRLVLNFILLNNMVEAMEILKEHPFFENLDAVQLQASRLTPLGKGYYFKPGNPTYIISCTKKEESNHDSE